MSISRQAVLVGAFGLVLSSAFAVRVLASADWDATVFAAFGEQDFPTREYAEEKLGEVILRPQLGHDGRFFFVQANDPWMLEPAENISVVDRPLYRAQRMLYPVLASGGGLSTPTAVVWGMLMVNVIAMGLGTWAVASIALQLGGSAWWGLTFVLNIGFISEMNIGAAGVLAGAAAFGAVALWMQGRYLWGLGLMTFAVLSREAMLLAALGAAWFFWRQGKKQSAVYAAVVPTSAAALWAIYLRVAIGGGSGADQIEEIGLPFVGFFESFARWVDDPIDLAIGVAMMLLFALFVRRVFVSDRLVGWAFVGFVALAVLFTEQVWRSYFDITRAVAPVITSFVLLVFLTSGAEEIPDG